MMRIAYIGGGPCALFSAHYLLSHSSKFEVHIFEASTRSGRKIYSSGNGRGNLSNTNVRADKYNDPIFVQPALSLFGPDTFLNYVHEMGLWTMSDEDGRIYPYAESAAVFADLLKNQLTKLGAIIHLNEEIKALQPFNNGYLLNDQDYFDAVVITTGSVAGIPLAQRAKNTFLADLHVAMVPLRPTLSSIGVKENLSALDGIRAKAIIKLVVDGKEVFKTRGELLFRRHALSGIAIFECSTALTWEMRKKEIRKANLVVDFFPDEEASFLTDYLTHIFLKPKREDILAGFFPLPLAHYLYREAQKVKSNVFTYSKQAVFPIDLSFIPDNNQVFSGGISRTEIDAQILQLIHFPHLYAGGEAIDIDGFCGGYNLHWAWASGVLIATSLLY